MANISVTKAYWARRKAREEVHGRAILQYGKLRDYYAEIMRTNPGSTTQILVDRASITHEPRFMRMYMCLDSVKQGFLASCRPIIGVDGCHLKGDHGQQLLVAVGRDPNDNYFPIAVATVEAETRDSWDSLLTCYWMILDMSGLMQVFQEMMLALEHRLYLRHLYANCKRAYGGGTILRDLILSIAKATYVEEWERRMTQLMHINHQCYEKLASLDPKLWCKSHFTFLAKSDMLMNNISEAFNGRILEARDKPILTIFEWIQCYWMSRFAKKKKKKAEKYKGTIMPKPKKKLNVIAMRAMEWQARWARGLTYEISHKNWMIVERFVVDLLAGTCSCRFWGLCGMPCSHACCAIFEKRDNPKDYCSNFYSPAAYLATYEPDVAAATNGEDSVGVDTVPAADNAETVYTDPAADNRSGVNGQKNGQGRGRGRGRAASSQPLPTTPASSQQLPTTPLVVASTQPPPILATSVSQTPTTATGAVAPTTATSQQALPLEGPTSQPLLAMASENSQQKPRASSQPLLKTKVFGVRRSGRLKLGVRKEKGAPSLHIDINDD
ncbi:uncharacterized protein LOC107607601 [Arachis ipaensis]|uniref:uncharacterized protein LOC107607601 n=1 Tax=Arachis ipaensis TaxID=130454 RepID=UPI0007AF8DF1|nr:uncharacterized protein LOC107607601 [Arachis ipaensis]XP_025665087.1 uncharacterized protein LOC112763699 [Arachis hypogaea]